MAVQTAGEDEVPAGDSKPSGASSNGVDAPQTGPRDRQQWTTIRHVAEEVAAKATRLSDSIFGHMLEQHGVSAAMARRRAMMLVDVLVERHSEGRLKKRWVFAAAFGTFCYLRYALPALSLWGTRHFERSVGASEFAETVGGPSSRVSFAVLVMVTLCYLSMLHCSTRVMEARLPVKKIIFETLVVYNMSQTLLNAYVFVQLLREARAQGFQYPWGNQFNYTQESHKLGYFIWFHYHCCQLELLDTLFVVIRKKFQKITFLHVWLRILNMWAWFFACRYACGGDTYFPAATNAGTRAVVYAFYSLSLLTERGMPLFRKARVTEIQMFQFAICACHALFCVYNFWNMQIPRVVLVLYFLVMMNGLMLYTDFHFQVVGKSEAKVESGRKVSIAFDSSGWLYCYHFGVAAWLREHLLPEGLTPEDSETDKFPANLTFSGSSGGALVAASLSMGLEPSKVFELVLEKRQECAINPFRMLPAVEGILNAAMPENAYRCLSGRFRVLLTRVSFRYPFFTAEVVNKFSSNKDVFHALRASCHVPVIGGLGPYRYDGQAYFDGMFWPQVVVPWKGTPDDFVVRISALLSGPSADIRPPMLPTWWSVFPPDEATLRGMFWLGYQNAARWFSEIPRTSFECLSCWPGAASGARSRSRSRGRLPSQTSEQDQSPEHEEQSDRFSTWAAAQKVLLRKPSSETLLPDVDPVTGLKPIDFVKICEAAIERDRWRIGILAVAVLVIVMVWFLVGWL